jgi:hypothetical protein
MAKIKPSKDAYAAADAILSGNFVDVTGGATHYYNPKISDPKWGERGGGDWQKIGAHLFGKAGAFNTGASNMNKQPTAQQMQQMQRQRQQGGGGLMGFLQNPINREVLTSFSRSSVGEKLNRIASREREYARETERDNKTAQWLMNQPKGRPYAEAIMSGAMTGQQAYDRWISETQRSGTKIGEKLIDPVTGEVIYDGDSEAMKKLDKDQNAIVNQQNSAIYKILKPYNEIFNAYGQISRAIANQKTGEPSGVNDLVISISFSKLLDPESVVRAEESAAVAAAGGGVAAAFGGLMNFLGGKGMLPPEVRSTIMTTTQQTADNWFNMVNEERERALKQLELSGIPRNISEEVLMKPKPPKIEPLPTGGGGDGNGDVEQPNGPVPSWAAPLTQEQWNKLSKEKVQQLTKQAEAEGKI